MSILNTLFVNGYRSNAVFKVMFFFITVVSNSNDSTFELTLFICWLLFSLFFFFCIIPTSDKFSSTFFHVGSDVGSSVLVVKEADSGYKFVSTSCQGATEGH